MQFVASNKKEYIDTVIAIVDSNIHDQLAIMYAVSYDGNGELEKLPEKYPCIVSIEIEESNADNRKYSYASLKFIYNDDLLTGSLYVKKLQELQELDVTLAYLSDKINTSGTIDKPIMEYEALNTRISEIERLLF